MIRAILVDDELAAVKSLEILLASKCPEVNVVGIARSAEEALALASRMTPDLVFLDVEMPPKTGFDFLAECPNIDFEVIFVTAYNHYAVKAFKHSAVDYILKPIDVDELKEAVKKVQKILASKTSSRQRYNLLFENLKEIIPRKLVALTTTGFVYLDTQNIAAITTTERQITFYLCNSDSLQYQLVNLDVLPVLEEKGFVYLHENTYVNIAAITRIDKTSGGKVLLCNGLSYPITEVKRDELVEIIQHYKGL